MSESRINTDVIIIGASASGLMCAIEAGKRGRKVIVLDHANKAGKKILMSGGGRCNFTNMDIDASHFISHNPHFCKSALSRYTQWDFIALVNEHNIAWHERDHGQLFCKQSAKDIINMLLAETDRVGADVILNSKISEVVHQPANTATGFLVKTATVNYEAASLVVASGGLSIPKMCASPLGYQLAEYFGHHIWPTSPGLVPFTLHKHDKEKLAELAGVSVDAIVSNDRIQFRENILFTHRGISGPAILQISSYWQPGESVNINLLPELELFEWLIQRQKQQPNSKLKTVLAEVLPKRLLPVLLDAQLIDAKLQEISQVKYKQLVENLQCWTLTPNATEGYRTAEVTLGGIDCDEISSKTMQSNKVDGLYFIGEVLDVTGWLGGYNFQWAWSSGWCAGQVV